MKEEEGNYQTDEGTSRMPNLNDIISLSSCYCFMKRWYVCVANNQTSSCLVGGNIVQIEICVSGRSHKWIYMCFSWKREGDLCLFRETFEFMCAWIVESWSMWVKNLLLNSFTFFSSCWNSISKRHLETKLFHSICFSHRIILLIPLLLLKLFSFLSLLSDVCVLHCSLLLFRPH